jgi:predicted site-specific integrase-resolvase
MHSRLYLTDRELIEVLGVSRSTLARWRHDGIGPPWVRLEGTVRYPKEDLDRYIAERTTKVS